MSVGIVIRNTSVRVIEKYKIIIPLTSTIVEQLKVTNIIYKQDMATLYIIYYLITILIKLKLNKVRTE